MKLLNAPIYDYVEDVLKDEDIHDIQRVPVTSAGNSLFIVLAILLTLLHGFNLYLFLGTDLWPAIPVLLHIVISVVTLLITYSQYRRGMDVQHLGGMAIISTFTGVFGTIGALLGFLVYLLHRQKALGFMQWYESIFPTDHISQAEQIYDNILEGIDEHPTHYHVMPFVDIMRLGSDEQKHRALSRMTTRFHPRLAPAFKIALHDQSNAVRVQAATAIAKLERNFTTMLEQIEEARVRAPRNSQLLFALARFYDDYAFTGILDKEIEQLNRNRALEAYRGYLQQDGSHQESWVAIGRILFRSEQFEEAANWMEQAINQGIHVKSLYLWYFESLFRLKKFEALRKAMQLHGRDTLTQEELPHHMRDAVELWMRAAA
jgi:hypothetical protein